MEPKYAKRFSNIKQAYMTGFEWGFTIKFLKTMSYDLSAAYTYAMNKSWDEPLPEIPPFTVNTSLFYKAEKLQTGIKALIAAEQNRVSQSFSESTSPGYAVLDFMLDYRPFKLLELNASVNNIFDINYAGHLSRAYNNMETKSLYYEPGRSFNIGLKLLF
jgi:iron complex outermembrane receptor protein